MLNIPVFAALSSGVLDMPGHFSVTAYVAVCNARCPYCYNKKMMAMAPTFTLGDALAQLEKLRKYAPDAGLVLSGGEPTAHPLFEELLAAVPADVPVGLHTNGLRQYPCVPDRVASVIMSVKTRQDGAHMEPHMALAQLKAALALYQRVPFKELRCVMSAGSEGEVRHQTFLAAKPYAESLGWKCAEVPCIDEIAQTLNFKEMSRA